MAKILCAYSGISFKTEHFSSLHLESRECYHPIFALPPKKLVIYYQKWVASELDSTESYLLFLALLASTELVEFRVPVKKTEETASLVANHMPALFQAVTKLAGIKHPRFSVPSIAITPETCTLSNIKYWIQTWNTCYVDFLSGLGREELRSKLARREAGLEKLIKSPQIKPEKYAGLLAAWAAEAAAFPEFTVLDSSNNECTLSAYWQDIIVRCYRTENILSIPAKDLKELTEHCEEHIEATGSLFSYHLFAALEEGKSRQTNFFGLGDMMALTADNPGFRVLDSKTSVEDANIAVLIDSAPISKPERSHYASDFQYLKAKSKWELAAKYVKTS